MCRYNNTFFKESEMELNEKLIEAIILSATTGQFGGQIVYETFKLSFDEMNASKKQLFTHLISGLVAFFAYFFTQETFVVKAATLAFLSGVFAEAALKMLKHKNELQKASTDSLKEKLEENEKDAKIKQLEELLKKTQEDKNVWEV